MTLPLELSCVDTDTPTPAKLPPPALRLLVELRKRATETVDGAVVATRSDLAKVLGVSDRTICRARADLTSVGLLDVEGPDQRYCGNTYRIQI
jgi:hypothetical protein